MTDPAVFAEALCRNFGDVEAVRGVDLEVGPGEVYGFLGPNGAGKSTIIRVLTTLLKPSSGRALVAGKNVATQDLEVRLRIGVALQEAGLDPKQTGLELLRLQGSLYGLTRRQVSQRIDELTPMIDIGQALMRQIGTYSGGMKRRLDLAASLMHNPQVLFLDEPTTGLDPISRSLVWEEVRRINRDLGVTVFLTTQYLEEADALADRVGIINRGELVLEGAPDRLKRNVGSDVIIVTVEAGREMDAEHVIKLIPGVDEANTHGREISIKVKNGPGLVSEVALALNRIDIRAEEITVRRPTLDDVFLNVTGTRLGDDMIEADLNSADYD